jgi:AhpD family alkylhydroperoxidase
MPTIAYETFAPGVEAMMALTTAVYSSGIERSLIELVDVRASQLNGCAFCLDMHAKSARAEGESEQRLYLLSVWREAGCFTDRERAALALTESLTLVATGGVPGEVRTDIHRHFDADERVALLYAITCINAWNRLAIASEKAPASRE